MYMIRNAILNDSVTLVIEDPERSAVNISTIASNAFDYFLSTALLPSIGSRGSTQVQVNPPQPQQIQPYLGKWIPRPSFAQVEGITLHDPSTDFQISIGLLSTRGGNSGANSAICRTLIVQVEHSDAAGPMLLTDCISMSHSLSTYTLPFYQLIPVKSLRITSHRYCRTMGLTDPYPLESPL